MLHVDASMYFMHEKRMYMSKHIIYKSCLPSSAHRTCCGRRHFCGRSHCRVLPRQTQKSRVRSASGFQISQNYMTFLENSIVGCNFRENQVYITNAEAPPVSKDPVYTGYDLDGWYNNIAADSGGRNY